MLPLSARRPPTLTNYIKSQSDDDKYLNYQFGQLKFISTMNSILAVGLFAALAVVCSAGDYAAANYNGNYAFHGYYPGMKLN